MIKLTKGVALLHFGRTGSTLVASMISQNKLFYNDGEVFEKVRTGTLLLSSIFKTEPERILKKRRQKFFYRDYLVSIKPIPEEHLRDNLLNMSYPKLIQTLKSANIDKYIIIKRKNYLLQVLSGKLAQEWKKYHFREGEKAESIKVRIDVKDFRFGTFKGELIDLFKRFDAYYDEMINETPKALLITYEDDIEHDPFIAYDKIKSYLNLGKERPKIILSKSNTFKNEDVIENYEDVIKYLRGTPYEWML